ncbi:MAG: TonB-dependent receptor [Verrucomicrobia bacterium]|nr:TonB-dependent receptor [Verrucomicrobiota bacterium]
MKKTSTIQRRASVFRSGVFSLLLAFTPFSAQPTARAAAAGAPGPSGAQTTSTGPAAAPASKSDEILQLSLFEVSTTQDKGYVTTNAATGFKTNQPLLSIPQAITVVTRDLLDDIGYSSSSDALQFAGVGRLTVGTEGVMLRGNRIGNPIVDEFPNGGPPYLDNIHIDSYEVIRGPAAVFYINSSLGGAVLKTTRKPLPYRATTLSFSADQYGTYRATVDTTGPLGSIGEGKFSYRLCGVVKGGDQYFKYRSEKTFGLFPTLQFRYKDTTVRVAVDYTRLEHYPQAHSFVTPDGQVYTGAGRDENYQAPNNLEDFTATQVRLSFLHRFSDGWEMKLNAANNRYKRGPTGIILPGGGVNWITQTITFTARRNYQDFNNNYAMGDVSGKYDLFGLKSQTIAGFQFTEETSDALFQSSTVFGGGTGTITRPIANPDMGSIVIPNLSTYIRPANPGGRSARNNLIAYIQQQIDVVPDRLSLVAGWTSWGRQETSIPNPSLPRPVPSTFTRSSGVLHRYGVVGYVTKEISLYALESTVLQPNIFGILADGTQLPNQIGKGQEVGVKTALLGGRVSATLSFFDITLSNQSTFAGVLPDGRSYSNLIGSTSQKGWDVDLEVKLLPNWQVVATAFHGDNKTATGAPVSASYRSSWSVFTRYDFAAEPLKGFSIGGGATTKTGWIVASGGLTLPVPKAFIDVKDGVLVNFFANYKIDKHWSARVNVENVLDETYPAGFQAAWLVDPSQPRTFAFSTTYKF